MYMYPPSNQVPTQNTGIATHMACSPRDSVLGSATAPSSMITRTARFLKEHPSRARATPQSHSLAFVLQTIAVCALQTMTSDFTELSCHKELALGIGISALLQIGKVRLDPLENEDPRTDGLTLVTTSKCPPRRRRPGCTSCRRAHHTFTPSHSWARMQTHMSSWRPQASGPCRCQFRTKSSEHVLGVKWLYHENRQCLAQELSDILEACVRAQCPLTALVLPSGNSFETAFRTDIIMLLSGNGPASTLSGHHQCSSGQNPVHHRQCGAGQLSEVCSRR